MGAEAEVEDDEEASIISLPSVCVCVLVVLLLPGLPSHLSKEGEKQQERTAFSIASTGPYPEMEGAGVRPLAHSVVIDDLTCNHHLLFSERLVKKMKKKGEKGINGPKLSTHDRRINRHQMMQQQSRKLFLYFSISRTSERGDNDDDDDEQQLTTTRGSSTRETRESIQGVPVVISRLKPIRQPLICSSIFKPVL